MPNGIAGVLNANNGCKINGKFVNNGNTFEVTDKVVLDSCQGQTGNFAITVTSGQLAGQNTPAVPISIGNSASYTLGTSSTSTFSAILGEVFSGQIILPEASGIPFSGNGYLVLPASGNTTVEVSGRFSKNASNQLIFLPSQDRIPTIAAAGNYSVTLVADLGFGNDNPSIEGVNIEVKSIPFLGDKVNANDNTTGQLSGKTGENVAGIITFPRARDIPEGTTGRISYPVSSGSCYFDGTFSGSGGQAQNPQYASDTVVKNGEYSGRFNVGNNGDQIRVQGLDLDTYNGTIETWFYPTNLGGQQNIFGNDNGNYDVAVVLNGNRLTLFNGNSSVDTGVDVQNNQWNHVALIIASNGMNLFLNENNVYSNSTGVVNPNGDDFMTIAGKPDNTSMFQGYLDDFRVTNALVYSTNFTPPTEALTELS